MKPDKNNNWTNIQDDSIQSLSLKELKELIIEDEFLFPSKGDFVSKSYPEENDYRTIDELIQNTQLAELKKIFKDQELTHQADELAIATKASITGLDKNTILLIETKKEKATLEQIMTYCRKLHIPFQQLIPEIFITAK
ncbi:MAG: hypothetical protein K9H16_04460 [Bacteroidales bacterium]|nr:hypothetical protein [Bacteroidales bacterium]